MDTSGREEDSLADLTEILIQPQDKKVSNLRIFLK